jgi:hypothetical protein
MSCSGSQNCDCGCCSGTSVQTPQGESNLPGLSAITYRTGTWASFNESMLARLSSSDFPALAQLKTRDSDDLTIAFLDASAVVLTFSRSIKSVWPTRAICARRSNSLR